MSVNFEELDYEKSALGELILRRRRFPILGELDVYEVILNDEFLMSSLFTAGEIALAELALELLPGKALDIVVGGLGLGYTAAAVLQSSNVASLTIVEALPRVIDWHQRELLPESAILQRDARTSFVADDFFALAEDSFSSIARAGGFGGILLDIDHSPKDVLKQSNSNFYCRSGLDKLRSSLADGGVFGLWSNDPPDQDFTLLLDQVFDFMDVHVIDVDNPLTGITAHNTVYLGRR